MPTRRPLASLTTILILGAALSWLLGGCAREKPEVIARVNQKPITQRDLWESMEQANDGEFAREILDSLITRHLIRQEAQKRNVELTQQEIQIRMDGLKDYVLASTGKDFEVWLADKELTEEDMLERLSLQMLTARLVLTDDAVKKYFEANKERLADLPHNNDSVIFRAITVATEEEAQAVRNELLADSADGKITGEKFAAVAKDRSLDYIGRHRGGMVGWMAKGKSPYPAIETVLFELAPGEVSEPVAQPVPGGPEEESPEGEPPQELWQVFMVEKRITGGEITLERNRDVIEDWMLEEPQHQYELTQFVQNLKARADVEVLAPRHRLLDEAYREAREARERRLAQPAGVPPGAPVLPEGMQLPGGEAPHAHTHEGE
jgi:parvulin-like peptidyl-prolyl isomerase